MGLPQRINWINKLLKKSNIVLLGLILVTTNVNSQDNSPAKFYLRGKAMTMVVIEDNWYSGISLGAEYRFHKCFSVVLDAVHYSNKSEREVSKNGDVSDYDEYAQRDRRNYLAIEFKYHFIQFKKWNNSSLYFNVYSKIGAHSIRTEDKYPLKENERYHLNGNFEDVGISLGININFTHNFGMDINLGACRRFEKQSYWKTDDNLNLVYSPQKTLNEFRPNIRLNFYWTFTRLFAMSE
ncbi:hypothetical protein [Fluviicola taffensis]|uniref:hypothetical protein n=1 Tax=Fluviicola taffensis TaxID=191579 RepID=UPI003137FBC2